MLLICGKGRKETIGRQVKMELKRKWTLLIRMMENEYEEKEQRKVKIDYIKGMYRGSLCAENSWVIL